jgi:outer membrane protein insertion porin family
MHIACAILILGILIAPPAFAQKTVKLAVLPFQINASPELAYLNESLPEMLGQKLRELEIPTVDQRELDRIIEDQQIMELDLQTARDIALLSSAQYAVYGSFSQIGESLSLDVRLVEAFGLKESKALFVVKEGLINLLPAIDELAEKISQEL